MTGAWEAVSALPKPRTLCALEDHAKISRCSFDPYCTIPSDAIKCITCDERYIIAFGGYIKTKRRNGHCVALRSIEIIDLIEMCAYTSNATIPGDYQHLINVNYEGTRQGTFSGPRRARKPPRVSISYTWVS